MRHHVEDLRVLPGMNARACPKCKDLKLPGTLFIPFSFKQQALVNCGRRILWSGSCHTRGHFYTYSLTSVGQM